MMVAFFMAFAMLFPSSTQTKQPEDCPKEPLYVFVCPLQRADAILLVQGAQVMLVDTGEATDFPIVSQLLDQLSIRRIDYVVNSHPHHDHLGGLPELVANYEVGEFITCFPAGFEGQGVVQRQAIQALHDKDIPICFVDHGECLLFGDSVISVYRQTDYKSVNAQSMMLLLEYNQCSMLLTADITVDAQNAFLREGFELKSDVLKVPHHGRERMSSAFLEKVDPSCVFITNGYSDSEETRKQLQQRDIPYFVTKDGLICFECDGFEWRVSQ